MICPKCGSSMLPWRHSQTWRAFTCWSCAFVKIERLDAEEGRAVDGGGRQPMATPGGDVTVSRGERHEDAGETTSGDVDNSA